VLLTMQGLLDREVLFFGGKGGVGKTTCAAAMALAASRAGRKVLLVSTDPAHSTSDIFERPIGADPTELLPNLWGLEIDAATESARYVREVKDRVRDLFGHAILKEAYKQIDLAASMPGAEEVALFDRMGGLIRGEDTRFNLVIFDTAPRRADR
jgi:arsenite-transporting ATPase